MLVEGAAIRFLVLFTATPADLAAARLLPARLLESSPNRARVDKGISSSLALVVVRVGEANVGEGMLRNWWTVVVGESEELGWARVSSGRCCSSICS